MTRHNIAGSEAFSTARRYPVQEVARSRPSRARVVRWHVGFALTGGAISVADVLIGAPICLTITLIAVGAWALLPERR